MTKYLIVPALTFLIGGCAATPPRGEAKTIEEQLNDLSYLRADEVDSIPNYRVDGWKFVDTRHLILNTPPSGQYLLTLSIPCSDLIGQTDIGFTSTNTRLTKLDSIVVDQPGSSIPKNCPIERIDRLDRVSE